MDKKVKKVIVELADGNTLEFTGSMALFLEDEMTPSEKVLHKGKADKMLGVVQCSPAFLAGAVECGMEKLGEVPGRVEAIMLSHLVGKQSIESVLKEVLG